MTQTGRYTSQLKDIPYYQLSRINGTFQIFRHFTHKLHCMYKRNSLLLFTLSAVLTKDNIFRTCTRNDIKCDKPGLSVCPSLSEGCEWWQVSLSGCNEIHLDNRILSGNYRPGHSSYFTSSSSSSHSVAEWRWTLRNKFNIPEYEPVSHTAGLLLTRICSARWSSHTLPLISRKTIRNFLSFFSSHVTSLSYLR